MITTKVDVWPDPDEPGAVVIPYALLADLLGPAAALAAALDRMEAPPPDHEPLTPPTRLGVVLPALTAGWVRRVARVRDAIAGRLPPGFDSGEGV